jgi:hypothetical protein
LSPWRPDATSVDVAASSSLTTNGVSLAFYRDDDGTVVLLERVSSPQTWTEYLEKRARRDVEREQPTPTRIRIRR